MPKYPVTLLPLQPNAVCFNSNLSLPNTTATYLDMKRGLSLISLYANALSCSAVSYGCKTQTPYLPVASEMRLLVIEQPYFRVFFNGVRCTNVTCIFFIYFFKTILRSISLQIKCTSNMLSHNLHISKPLK